MRWRRLGRRLKKFFTERVSLKWVPLRGDIWGIRLPRILLYVVLLCLLGYVFSITYLYRSYQDRFADAQATIIELQELKAENLTLKIGLAKVARETEKMRKVVSELEQKGQRLQPLLSNPPTTSNDTQPANVTPANATSNNPTTTPNNGTLSQGKNKSNTGANSTTPANTKAGTTKSNNTKTSNTKGTNTKSTNVKPNNAKPATTPEKPDAKKAKSTVSVNDAPRTWDTLTFAEANRDANDIVMFNYRLFTSNDTAPQGGGQFNTLTNGFELLGQIQEDLYMISAMIPSTEAFLQALGITAVAHTAVVNATPFGWPLKDGGEGYISSGFGFRKDPMTGERVFHEGLDIGTWYGTPVTATADGTVVFAGWQADYGRLIIVDHGYGYQTRYGHNSKIAVKPGDTIKRGTIIGYTGNSGRSTGPHLHYEVRVNGIPRDPVEYYFRN